MAAALSQLSACVTRILSLTGFPKELKTKDIQAAFSEWDNVGGGFKIKWIDDTSLLIVFNEASVAKQAYLHVLAFPRPILASSNSSTVAVIKPYDGPDAQDIIQSVTTRSHNNGGRVRGSVSHGRAFSVSQAQRNNNLSNGSAQANGNTIEQGNRDREPSPTLPNIPSHPTLNSLISSSLGTMDPTSDPAVIAAQPEHGAPRIGDPGKRMLGAALGVRHPSLGPRVVGGPANGIPDMQRALAGLVGSD